MLFFEQLFFMFFKHITTHPLNQKIFFFNLFIFEIVSHAAIIFFLIELGFCRMKIK